MEDAILLNLDTDNDNVSNTEIPYYFNLHKCVSKVKQEMDKPTPNFAGIEKEFPILGEIPFLQNISDGEIKKIKNDISLKTKIMSSLLELCYQKCQNNSSELLFFAAATCNVKKLEEIVNTNRECINNIRLSNSALNFLFRYGDLTNENFVNCVTILIKGGININWCGVGGRYPIDMVVKNFYIKHGKYVKGKMKVIGNLLLESGICEPQKNKTLKFIQKILNKDLASYEYKTLPIKEQLFYWIAEKEIEKLKKFLDLEKYVDVDNGENTLLQFATYKKAPDIIKLLLQKGADPLKITKTNNRTPLEIAASRNYSEEIFKILLDRQSEITQQQFNNFVKWRGVSMDRKLFQLILESEKLNPEFVYEKTGNTPLYYAIRLCHEEATYKLLKRSDKSLTIPNNSGKSPLSVIKDKTLKKYLDSCLELQNESNIEVDSTEFKVQFNFKHFVNKNNEMDLVSNIIRYKHLETILTHPLIHTFIMLKWFKAENYFWFVVFLQACIFVAIGFCFYYHPQFSTLCLTLTAINIVVKSSLFFLKKNKCDLTIAKFKNGYIIVEIVLMLTLISSFFIKECRAFIFIEMATAFSLTLGFHPKLSHWSVMLQKIFKTFLKLLLGFFILIIGFGLGFHVMFNNDQMFKNLMSSWFMMNFLTIGAVDISEEKLSSASTAGYVLYSIFAISMSVVIINFWTGITIRDIDNFEKFSEANALKNVTAFLNFVEKLYSVVVLKWIFADPSLFGKSTKFENSKPSYLIDFYPNKDDQFTCSKRQQKRRFPLKLNRVCFDKIKLHLDNHHDMEREKCEKSLETILAKIVNNENNIAKIIEMLNTYPLKN